MTIAVINCGSSSVKYSLFQGETLLHKGLIEHVQKPTYVEALLGVGDVIKGYAPLIGIGHRVVHGGPFFHGSTLIDHDVLDKINECRSFAPLHNPVNLLGIFEMRALFPDIPHVAVFDTAFHHTIPPFAHIYPIPYRYYELHKIRRYGFHGISHEYLAIEGAKKVGKPLDKCSFITAHLGNGASVCAIEKGKSVDTSMGFTPLEGLMMGTRSGSIDPSLIEILSHIDDGSAAKITQMLNDQSGLLGISGISNDMRHLHADGSPRSLLAIDMFVDRLAKGIAAMRSALSSCDALIFGGGIGENDPVIREKTLSRLSFLGLSNAFVIHTDEEKMIMQEVLSCLSP